jgi:hypothetical protein
MEPEFVAPPPVAMLDPAMVAPPAVPAAGFGELPLQPATRIPVTSVVTASKRARGERTGRLGCILAGM